MMKNNKSQRSRHIKLLALIPIVGVALALNAKTVTHYVYDEPQKQQPIKKGKKAGTIKLGNEEIQVKEGDKAVKFKAVFSPENSPIAGVPVEVIQNGNVIMTTETDTDGKISLTPPIGSTVRFTLVTNVKEVKVTQELLDQAGTKTIAFDTAAEKIYAKEVPSDFYDVVEEMPQFPGGTHELLSYLAKNIRYPKESEDAGKQGRVIVTFVVGKDGSISDTRVVKSVDPLLDAEALRVIKAMPNWTPGKQGGEAVNVKYTVPVTFRLQGKDAELSQQYKGSLKYDGDSKGAKQVSEVVVVGYGDQKPDAVDMITKPSLVIVDGKTVDDLDKVMKEIDPKTIETMTMLKDKAAIEQYGEKAKDGVVIITTKKK